MVVHRRMDHVIPGMLRDVASVANDSQGTAAASSTAGRLGLTLSEFGREPLRLEPSSLVPRLQGTSTLAPFPRPRGLEDWEAHLAPLLSGPLMN